MWQIKSPGKLCHPVLRVSLASAVHSIRAKLDEHRLNILLQWFEDLFFMTQTDGIGSS